MFSLHNISYLHPNGDLLFDKIDLSLYLREKIALVGDNGVGKSTLLKIIAGIFPITSGQIELSSKSYYIPQVFGQYNQLTVAQALKVDYKLKALKAILEGDGAEVNFTILEDDWTIEEKCIKALMNWSLSGVDFDTKLSQLSGGEKTKVFLAGITIHSPKIILFDEPSNHLDKAGRDLLYNLIQHEPATMLVVSHDRKLLNLLDRTCELSRTGIKEYGGNYDFYLTQKKLEQDALLSDRVVKEKELRKAKAVERETSQRLQKLEARGKNKQEKAGAPRIMLNTLRNKAENNIAKSRSVHAEKISEIGVEVRNLKNILADNTKIKLEFLNSSLIKGKILFRADNLNHSYREKNLWNKPLCLLIESGERIVLSGLNGSGKTTLIKIILGELIPKMGNIFARPANAVYIDQEYSLIKHGLTVYEQAWDFSTMLLEYEIKIRLDRFLFTKEHWNKQCVHLSGGEKMRLLLCCLTLRMEAPSLIVLDEPTNNLDLRSLSVLSNALKEYQGTLLLVSHDELFLKEVGYTKVITL